MIKKLVPTKAKTSSPEGAKKEQKKDAEKTKKPDPGKKTVTSKEDREKEKQKQKEEEEKAKEEEKEFSQLKFYPLPFNEGSFRSDMDEIADMKVMIWKE